MKRLVTTLTRYAIITLDDYYRKLAWFSIAMFCLIESSLFLISLL